MAEAGGGEGEFKALPSSQDMLSKPVDESTLAREQRRTTAVAAQAAAEQAGADDADEHGGERKEPVGDSREEAHGGEHEDDTPLVEARGGRRGRGKGKAKAKPKTAAVVMEEVKFSANMVTTTELLSR